MGLYGFIACVVFFVVLGYGFWRGRNNTGCNYLQSLIFTVLALAWIYDGIFIIYRIGTFVMEYVS